MQDINLTHLFVHLFFFLFIWEKCKFLQSAFKFYFHSHFLTTCMEQKHLSTSNIFQDKSTIISSIHRQPPQVSGLLLIYYRYLFCDIYSYDVWVPQRSLRSEILKSVLKTDCWVLVKLCFCLYSKTKQWSRKAKECMNIISITKLFHSKYTSDLAELLPALNMTTLDIHFIINLKLCAHFSLPTRWFDNRFRSVD